MWWGARGVAESASGSVRRPSQCQPPRTHRPAAHSATPYQRAGEAGRSCREARPTSTTSREFAGRSGCRFLRLMARRGLPRLRSCSTFTAGEAGSGKVAHFTLTEKTTATSSSLRSALTTRVRSTPRGMVRAPWPAPGLQARRAMIRRAPCQTCATRARVHAAATTLGAHPSTIWRACDHQIPSPRAPQPHMRCSSLLTRCSRWSLCARHSWWTTCEDSVRQTAELLGELERSLCYDPRRVYAVGCSNGGIFLYELATSHLAPAFAAFMPIIG